MDYQWWYTIPDKHVLGSNMFMFKFISIVPSSSQAKGNETIGFDLVNSKYKGMKERQSSGHFWPLFLLLRKKRRSRMISSWNSVHTHTHRDNSKRTWSLLWIRTWTEIQNFAEASPSLIPIELPSNIAGSELSTHIEQYNIYHVK